MWSTDYIPRGTRFGPLTGDKYEKDNVPADANRKYFWRVYTSETDYHYVDGFDVMKANWMRYVNPAYSSENQNLVACQVNEQIYFYTIKPILPNQELLVWYCREFAERLNYPASGELMLQRIRKYTLHNSRKVLKTYQAYAHQYPRAEVLIIYFDFQVNSWTKLNQNPR